MKKERIAKIIARSGYCSRRDAEKLILEHRVMVNGELIQTPALNVSDKDDIVIDGEPIAGISETRLWLYHKPRGLITSHGDPQGRKTVFETLPKELGRVISVGRLDLNTEGLLLLTNDGELSRKLEMPASGFSRCYKVKVYGHVTDNMLAQIRAGLKTDDIQYKPAKIKVGEVAKTSTWLELTLTEGKNREIRNIFEHFGLRVSRLIRISYHTFKLDSLKRDEVKEVEREGLAFLQ